MRVVIVDLIPIMQCPECGEFTEGGNRRPGIDHLHKGFFWKCKCGWKGFSEAVRWEGEVKE